MNNLVYAHEHITIDLSGVKGDLDCRMDDDALAVSELSKLAALGVTAIVDQTALGMGRRAGYAARVAAEAGLRVLHATGFYKEPFLPKHCYALDERQMAALFSAELTGGIDGTTECASLIGEIGTGKERIAPIEETIFRAAARAHAETGAPICTHTTLGTLGMEQVALLRDNGADLSRVVLSHIDLSGDLDYMLRLLDTGVNIAFDTVGKNNYQPDASRAAWLSELCRRGYSGQIVLSMDITRLSNCRELGYDYLLRDFVPRLQAQGVTSAWLDRLLSINPCRIYGI